MHVQVPGLRRWLTVAMAVVALLAARASLAQEVRSPAVVHAVTLTAQGSSAVLTLEMSEAVAYQIKAMSRPDRIVIDLPKVVFAASAARPGRRIGPVSAHRFGLFFADRSRVVLDLGEPALVEAVEPRDQNGRKLLAFRIAPVERGRFQSAATAAEPPSSAAPVPARLPVAGRNGGAPLVIIDPGHGGIDPGASTSGGETEKAVVLALGLALKERLEKSGRLRVAMTRTEDVFISLADRVRIAREQGAALMVSLHADTLAYEPGVRGASVYTLSEKASDDISARLADAENRADLLAGVDVRDEDGQVGDILFDLTKRETRAFSHHLARNVVETLGKSTSMHKNPLRSAGFRVLKAPDVPSVLIEVGYLSSESDARLMQSLEWRTGMAEALAAAVEKYIDENATRMGNSAPKP